MYKGLGLFIILAVALAAALLVRPDEAGAQSGHCPSTGIVPGSVSVISTNNVAGHVSAHVVRFQLSRGIGGPTKTDVNGDTLEPPDKIGLLWEGFTLDEPDSSGVTLSVTGGARRWPATTEISHRGYEGLAVEFSPEQLNALGAASAESPLTLQFNVPVTAGMMNPVDIGNYRLDVVLFYDFSYCCGAINGDVTSSIVPAYIAQELQLFPKSGTPGSTLTLLVYHFKPLAPVQSIKVGGVDVTPDYKMTTDYWGDFELEIQAPGLEQGRQPIEVQMGGKSASADFTIEPSRFMGLALKHPLEASTALGDNFVSLFHYNRDNCRWSFFDPEFQESDLTYLIPREHYWILVKEPLEVELNRKTHNLTCTPEGNCWNRIVW